jgi:hypothetical protein
MRWAASSSMKASFLAKADAIAAEKADDQKPVYIPVI